MTIEVLEQNRINNKKKNQECHKKHSYPIRRYGLEVDKIEDVGITVMCDDIYPAQSVTMEEYLSFPQEHRDRIETDLSDFFENHKTTFPAAIKKAVKNQLAKGFPIVYGDREDRVLKRYPDGKIFLVKTNMETYESTETFLRMATPEDNYWDK